MGRGQAISERHTSLEEGKSTRAALRARYDVVRAYTERLCEPLGAEDQTAQSMPDASPAKWHRAHTTWFFETFVLRQFSAGYAPFDPSYEYLFNSYYNAVGEQYPRPQRGLITRPGIERIRTYREHVDGAMDALLSKPLEPRAAALIELGLHHEQQHQELLLTDLKHLWSHNPLDPVYSPAPREAKHAPDGEMRWQQFEGGIVHVGHDGEGFAFDNEGPRHRVLLQPFALAERLVNTGEWLAFVEDGGYRRPELWLDAGFQWVQAQGIEAPLYWRRERDGSHTEFTLHGRRPLALEQPVVHLSYFEADAYARWAEARLPSEAEWEHAAPPPRAERPGDPPSSFAPEHDGGGDHYGVAWQWTRSDYAAYPGFRPAPGAVGEYNGKFMCGQYVLRGSSLVTPSGHARLTYRNFFPPSARWQFTGLRLARDL